MTLNRSHVALAFSAIAAAVFSWTLVHATLYAPNIGIKPDQALAAQAPIAHAPSSQLPARLIIPALNINAAVQRTSLKADGSMGTPDNFTDVAWYEYGPIPGQLGSAVIDGHVDNGLGLDGVFKHLNNISVGDDVYVERQDGSRLHFVVVAIEEYPYNDLPSKTVFDQTDAARLNLITCEGTWISQDKTYNERLVVYTELAGPAS